MILPLLFLQILMTDPTSFLLAIFTNQYTGGNETKDIRQPLPKQYSAKINERNLMDSGIMILKEHETGFCLLFKLLLFFFFFLTG